MKKDNPRLKYWILLDDKLNPVSGTLRKSKTKPKVGHWVDITTCARVCCNKPVATSLIIAPIEYTMSEREELELTVYVVYSDGTVENVTATAEYTSDDEGVATVEEGVVHSIAAGDTTISASYGGLTVSMDIHVVN